MDKLKIHKNWKLEKLKIRKIRKIENSRKKIQKLVLTKNSEKIEFNFCTKKKENSISSIFLNFRAKKKTSTTNGIFAVKIQIKSNI